MKLALNAARQRDRAVLRRLRRELVFGALSDEELRERLEALADS